MEIFTLFETSEGKKNNFYVMPSLDNVTGRVKLIFIEKFIQQKFDETHLDKKSLSSLFKYTVTFIFCTEW